MKVLANLGADIVRFNLGGIVAVVVGAIDLFAGSRLGAGVDYGLVASGLAALGLHVKDVVGVAAVTSEPSK